MNLWKRYNPNPTGRSNIGDCSVRAISAALGVDWGTAYALLATNGYILGDMPSSNSVIGAVLRKHGFTRHGLENTCPDCYSIGDFARDHPEGTFVVGTGNHVVAVIDGSAWDSWNSLDETLQYYWQKG